jgi:hypothetical protein
MRLVLLAACLALSGAAAAGDRATERYAPDQLQMAQSSLELARAAAALGDAQLVGTYAWQASVDARLAWAMSDSAAVRGPAARIFDEASRLVHRAAAGPLAP